MEKTQPEIEEKFLNLINDVCEKPLKSYLIVKE